MWPKVSALPVLSRTTKFYTFTKQMAGNYLLTLINVWQAQIKTSTKIAKVD
jgi:hypothetical protein